MITTTEALAIADKWAEEDSPGLEVTGLLEDQYGYAPEVRFPAFYVGGMPPFISKEDGSLEHLVPYEYQDRLGAMVKVRR